MRTILLPLDDRPCTCRLPKLTCDASELVDLDMAPYELLGHKKVPGSVGDLSDYLLDNAVSHDAMVISIDMLVFGGLVPSRTHELSISEALERLSLLERIRRFNPRVRIYAFSCVTRAAAYDSDEAEPTYCAQYGRALFRRMWLLDKRSRVGLDEAEESELSSIEVPRSVLSDYESRRKINLEINKAAVDYLGSGTIDYLVVPQDDSNAFGYTARDQRSLSTYIREKGLGLRVMSYPGADEVALTLLARAACDERGASPRIYPIFSSVLGPGIVPKYEDRPMYESLRLHVRACGARLVGSARQSDLICAVNAPGRYMQEASEQFDGLDTSYVSFRNAAEFARELASMLGEGTSVALCDGAFANGGDYELIGYLDELGVLGKLSSYAGWNTYGNSLGTALSQAILASGNLGLLVARIVDDVLYQSIVRRELAAREGTWREEEISPWLGEALQRRYDELRLSHQYPVSIERARLPWGRPFEVDFEIRRSERGHNEE